MFARIKNISSKKVSNDQLPCNDYDNEKVFYSQHFSRAVTMLNLSYLFYFIFVAMAQMMPKIAVQAAHYVLENQWSRTWSLQST